MEIGETGCFERLIKMGNANNKLFDYKNDCVSRQAVLGLFAQNADAVRPYSKTWEEVKALPSVNPQPICEEREKGECPYYAG